MSETTKATRAKIQIGEIDVDGFMLPDGEYRMSQRQIAEIIDLPRQSASDFLRSKAFKALLGDTYTGQKIEKIEIESAEQVRGQSRINALPLNLVGTYWF